VAEPLKTKQRLFWLVVFGAAFGIVEAAVVVYLRRIYYPGGFGFPLVLPRLPLLKLELVREAATLVMLLAVAVLAERRAWARFGAFALLFGVWDLVFYLVLRFAVGWPPSLLTWDILFLVPVPWTGPVLSAALVAASLVLAGGWIIVRVNRGLVPRNVWWVWLLALVSLMLLLGSFFANQGSARTTGAHGGFPWLVYGLGLVLGWVGFVAAFVRTDRSETLIHD
jgi:hypothetical protein